MLLEPRKGRQGKQAREPEQAWWWQAMAAASLVEPRLGWQPAQAGHAGCRQAKAAALLKMMAGGSVGAPKGQAGQAG